MKKSNFVKGALLGCLIFTFGIYMHPAVVYSQEKTLEPMELDGTQWAVDVVFINKKGDKETSQDVLIFKDKQFISEEFENDGYEPTNYSLTVSDDDITSFGTMQIKEKETTFWKGKVKKEKIDGSIHKKKSSGDNVTYYYSGKLTSGTLRRKGTKPVPPPPPPKPVAKPVPTPPPAPKKAEPVVPKPEAKIPETPAPEKVTVVEEKGQEVIEDVKKNSPSK